MYDITYNICIYTSFPVLARAAVSDALVMCGNKAERNLL